MNQQVLFAVSNLLKKELGKDPSGEFKVGVSHVEGEVTIKVKAVVTKLKDTDAKPTSSLMSKDTLAQFISRLGATQASVLKALEETWEAQLSGSEPRPVSDEVQNRVDVALAKFDRMVERLPKVPKKGSVTVAGTVEIIEPEPLKQAV